MFTSPLQHPPVGEEEKVLCGLKEDCPARERNKRGRESGRGEVMGVRVEKWGKGREVVGSIGESSKGGMG